MEPRYRTMPTTPIFYGANHNLFDLIKTHIFIVSPNNSGSTLVKNLFATSKHTWNLPREGQAMMGFQGVRTRGTTHPLLWMTNCELLKKMKSSESFDWKKNQLQWYFQSFSLSQHANIFIEKSPGSLVWINQLHAFFEHTKFIFMIRNPYAVVSSIARKYQSSLGLENATTLACTHIIHCMRQQKINIETYKDIGILIRYEDLCEKTDEVALIICELDKRLSDLDYASAVPVKGNYNERIRNMNDEQIAQLSTHQISIIRQYFNKNKDILAYYQYSVI